MQKVWMSLASSHWRSFRQIVSGFGMKNISKITRSHHWEEFSSRSVSAEGRTTHESENRNREREEIEVLDEWIADLDRNNCSVLKGE
jgi:hypothetical protein